MKRVKRAVCLVAMFILCAFSIAGCALFERDVSYYNNLVVATVGTDIKITKKQLIDSYNSFGYKYVSENSMTQSEAIDQTLDVLINREIVVQLSMQNFSFMDKNATQKAEYISANRNKKGTDSIFYKALNDNEKAQARYQSYSSLDEAIREYEDKVRAEWNIENKVTDESSGTNPNETTEPADAFKGFEPYIIRDASNTSFSINIASYVEEEDFTKKVPSEQDGWSLKISEQSVSAEAFARLARTLRNDEKGLKFSDDSDYAVVMRRLDELLEQNAKSILISRYQSIYEQRIMAPIDRSGNVVIDSSGVTFSNLLETYNGDVEAAYTKAVELSQTEFREYLDENGDTNYYSLRYTTADELAAMAREYYERQVAIQIDRFNKKLDTEETLGEKIVESLDGIYYIPNSMIEDYFTVSHILLSYSDEQQQKVTDWKSQLQQGKIDADQYAANLEGLKNEITVKERDAEGKETGAVKNATGEFGVLAEIQNRLSSVQAAEERINLFRDFIYKYNSDPGMVNPNYEYVIGLSKSKMVDEFTEAARELYGYAKNEDTDKYEKQYEYVGGEWVFKGKKGNMSDLVMTEYGAHIIMYTRPLSEFICSTTSFTGENSVAKYLYAPTTSYGNDFFGERLDFVKTTFDTIVDKLNRPAYSTYENSIISTYKTNLDASGQGITIHKKNFKDLI